MGRPVWLERIATAAGFSVSNTRLPGNTFARGAALIDAADALLALAGCEEPVADIYCVLCDRNCVWDDEHPETPDWDYDNQLTHHAESCPWRRAREWREQYARAGL